jgi:pSer/pThr/pTyr-binding forkhead associated (FHA) protein
MAKLILRVDGTGKEFDLDKTGSLTVGRSPDCDITIDDTQASRRHCTVVRLQSGYEVSDLGSTNGTLVNSTLVKKHKLRHGDVIRIGAVELAFDDPSSAGAAGEPAVGYLVYSKGEKKGQRIELTEQRTTIGRKPTNTIVIEDPVSSSYHCEIVRGLNGYTIRDLGSTNGTLVNSEMVTEAQLTHGARIRIGNTRFVFQDPALAEIDLDLAGAEDEDEWGMMRDIDLAAVRKRNPATIVYTVLFVAILAVLGYFLQRKPSHGPVGPTPPEGNLIASWSFEVEGSDLAWHGEPEAAVGISRSTQVKAQGAESLEIRSRVASAEAFYGTARLAGGHVRYHLKGMVAARGAKARIGLLWTGGGGLQRWTTAPAVESGSLVPVDLVASAPPWASGALLGVRIEGAGTVFLDDVSLVPDGAPAVEEVTVNGFKLTVTDGTTVDFFHYDAPVLINGRAFARDAQGGDVAAPGLHVTTKEESKETILLTVEGAGDAAVAGVDLEEVNGYLSQGGFRAFTPVPEGKEGKEGKTSFHASFPDEGTLALTDVRKLLLGSSGRSFAVLPPDGGQLDAVARVDGKQRTLALEGPTSEGRFSVRLKVDLRGENAEAANKVGNALTLYNQGHWGEFDAEATQILAEYPFLLKNTQDSLRERRDEVRGKYDTGRTDVEHLLSDYRDFRSQADLDAARTRLEELRAKYQITPGEGPRGQWYQETKAAIDGLDAAASEQRESRVAEPIFVQATLVNLPDNQVYSAAIQLYYITAFLPHAKQAAQAQQEFQKIAEAHPEVRVLEKLPFRRPR